MIFGSNFGWGDFSTFQGTVEFVITESPAMMSLVYAARTNCPVVDQMEQIAEVFNTQYNSLNVWINRGNSYQQRGRWQTLDQATRLDEEIFSFMKTRFSSFLQVNCSQWEEILREVINSTAA